MPHVDVAPEIDVLRMKIRVSPSNTQSSPHAARSSRRNTPVPCVLCGIALYLHGLRRDARCACAARCACGRSRSRRRSRSAARSRAATSSPPAARTSAAGRSGCRGSARAAPAARGTAASASGCVLRMISTARADDHEREQRADVDQLGQDASSGRNAASSADEDAGQDRRLPRRAELRVDGAEEARAAPGRRGPSPAGRAAG